MHESSTVVERVLRICAQVQVLFSCLNNTQLQVKVQLLEIYLGKSRKYSSQKLLRVLVTFNYRCHSHLSKLGLQILCFPEPVVENADIQLIINHL